MIKNIPLGVNERLSMVSSSEEIFNANIDIYQEALNDAGHKHKLKYVGECMLRYWYQPEHNTF